NPPPKKPPLWLKTHQRDKQVCFILSPVTLCKCERVRDGEEERRDKRHAYKDKYRS
uniref:Uncharacterized protein n=1 Tax=Electrophorus electricus TaxID=8005 RepID=A0A4W4E043_ELEEL